MRYDLNRAVLVASACIIQGHSDQGSPFPTQTLSKSRYAGCRVVLVQTQTIIAQKNKRSQITCSRGTSHWMRTEVFFYHDFLWRLIKSEKEDLKNMRSSIYRAPSQPCWKQRWYPRTLLYSALLQRLTVLHGRWYSSCRLHYFSPILSHPLVPLLLEYMSTYVSSKILANLTNYERLLVKILSAYKIASHSCSLSVLSPCTTPDSSEILKLIFDIKE